MISDDKLRTLAQEGHPILLLGVNRRELLGLARKIHAYSARSDGPLRIHRCGPLGVPQARSKGLSGLCARLFAQVEGGSLYFENVERLSDEERRELYMVLERRQYWDPDRARLVPVCFRILASATPDVLDPDRASSVMYRLAERIIRLPEGSSRHANQELGPLSD